MSRAFGDFETVSKYDPAVDFVKTPQDAYARFMGDRDHSGLLMHDGAQAAVFTLREIPREVFVRYVDRQATEKECFVAGFHASLVRVTHGVDVHGKPLPHPWEPAAVMAGRDSLDNTTSILTALEAAQFDIQTIYEIGGVAYSRSGFCLRGIVVRWAQLPLSREVWEAAQYRFLAERARNTAATGGTSNTPPASPPAEPTTPDTGSSG